MVKAAVRFGTGQAITAGIIAGLLFAVFEMLAAAVLMGAQAFFMPLRMIVAMVLGQAALDPGYSLVGAATAGVLVHMILSIIFAVVFAAIAPRAATTGTLIAIGIAFGVGLWLVNFYLIAPLMGWTWFPERTNPVVQFIAHAFFFGLPVAWYVGRSQPVIADRGL